MRHTDSSRPSTLSFSLLLFSFVVSAAALNAVLLGKKEPLGKNERIQPEGFSTVS